MSEKFIPLSVPNIRGNESKYVTEALRSEWVSTGGKSIEEFEKQIADYVKVKGAVACQSGTAGLHMALHYYGINQNDAVIVPTLTFIAAVNPVKYENATPIFMDCDESLCIDPIKLEEYLETDCIYDGEKVIDKSNMKIVKAIVTVHVFGNIADMEKIMTIAKRYNLPVIEDATEALGSYYTSGDYQGKYAGTIGDIGVFSFNGNKIITTGGGGMVVSNNITILNKIKYLSTQAKDDTVKFIHNEVGFNYRMTNIQAAIGLAQLEKLEEFILIKKTNYECYKAAIDAIDGMSILSYRGGIRPNYWFYSLSLDKEKFKKEELIDFLGKHQIQTRPIWGLISEQLPYLQDKSYKIEKAKTYFNRIINIPCSSNLTNGDVKRIIQRIMQYAKKGDECEFKNVSS